MSDRDTLVRNLIFCLYLISESEALLEDAIEESEGRLREYYVSHLEEERNHAKWLREDLGEEFRDIPTLYYMAKWITDTQFEMIKRNPVNLLGYMAVLEGNPMPMESLEMLESMHGLKLLRTLRFHAEEDVAHAKELWKQIDLENSPCILRSAIDSAKQISAAISIIKD